MFSVRCACQIPIYRAVKVGRGRAKEITARVRANWLSDGLGKAIKRKENPNNLEESKNILEKGNTRSMSKSKTRSMSNIYTGSAPAEGSAGVDGEKKTYGEFGWVKPSRKRLDS